MCQVAHEEEREVGGRGRGGPGFVRTKRQPLKRNVVEVMVGLFVR